jgi:hypothetical protein
LIQYLYEELSGNRISFFRPRKYIHFASGEFVSAFGIFMVVIIFLLSRQTRRQIFFNACAAIVLVALFTAAQCYFDGLMKLIECTACADGKRTLQYRDINYDSIFIGNLILAAMPALITEIKNYRSKNLRK